LYAIDLSIYPLLIEEFKKIMGVLMNMMLKKESIDYRIIWPVSRIYSSWPF